MNVRKRIDYSRMYAAIDDVMAQSLPQMQLYCSIGAVVCTRSEKGAAVMASEYIIANYLDAKGFSPRSLRRMRDFYRTYENHPALLCRAMKLGWIQNVVIMEADLTMDLREWYIKAVEQFGWSKTELIANIAGNAHENIVLAIEDEVCYIVNQEVKQTESYRDAFVDIMSTIHQSVQRSRKRWLIWKEGGRRWHTMLWETSMVKQIAFMRC